MKNHLALQSTVERFDDSLSSTYNSQATLSLTITILLSQYDKDNDTDNDSDALQNPLT